MKNATPVLNYVLLGLIHLHPRVSGYDLKSIIDHSTRYLFNASLSQIYPTLRILHEEDLVTYTVQPQPGRQDRKEYTITEKGRRALDEWLNMPLQLDFSLASYTDFLLRLNFFPAADRESLKRYILAGLDYYLAEEKNILVEDIRTEIAFVDPAHPDYDRAIFLWGWEYEYMKREVRLRIETLQSLYSALERNPAWDV